MKDSRIKLQLLKPFEVKYRLKKVEKPLLETLRTSIFGKRMAKKGEEEEPRKPINFMTYAPAIVGLLVFAGIFIFISSFASQISALMNVPPVPPHGAMELKGVYYSDYGSYENKKSTLVNVINISATANSSSTLTVYVTDRPLSKDIYLVMPRSIPPGSNESRLDEFAFQFSKSARASGLNPIVVNGLDLSRVPDGSTVMLPYGYPPDEVVSQFSQNSMKYITLIYIGVMPDFKMTADGNQAPLMPFWKSLGISFQVQTDIQIKSLNMRNALYVASDATKAYDAVSIIAPKSSNWNMVFIPNSLENGWEDGNGAAMDAFKVASSFDKWANFMPDAVNVTNVTLGRDYYFGSGMFMLGSHAFELIRLDVNNPKNISFSTLDIRSALKDYSGSLYAQETEAPKLLAYYISGQASRLELVANGTAGAASDPALDMSVIAANGTAEDKVRIGQSNLNSPIYYQYIRNGLNATPYLFEVSGAERYARTYIEFGGLNIRIIPNFNDAAFTFNFSSQGRPQEVSSATVTCTSCGNRSYSFSGRRTNFKVSMSDYFNGAVPVGRYNFTVQAGGFRTAITVSRPDTTGLGRLFSPTNMAVGIISLLIYFGGILLTRKEEMVFGIDVPDFPSIETIKIPLSRAAFLKIFEDINGFYKWNYTPVSIQDIKRQLSNIYFKGGRIYASDFNIEYIMDVLKKEGDVKEEMDFYGLASWEKDSGFTIKQLSMFRSLRDMCIENTVPFSEIGRTKGYHVELKLMWNSFFVYFYEPKEIRYIKDNFRALVKNGLVFIVFEDEASKRDFLDALSDGSRLSSTLRFYIDTGDVMLMTLSELEAKLKQLKG
jgi:hypothetical protein